MRTTTVSCDSRLVHNIATIISTVHASAFFDDCISKSMDDWFGVLREEAGGRGRKGVRKSRFRERGGLYRAAKEGAGSSKAKLA